MVKEMSSRKNVTECYSFLCDNIVTCRKMALSTAFAFRRLEKDLKGVPKGEIFQVELEDAEERGDEENTEI